MKDPTIEALRAEMQYLYESLHRIKVIAPFDAAFEIASAACSAYYANREREKGL